MGDSVNLDDCGKFTLAKDLSDIKDITSIDLSNISSLEGKFEDFKGLGALLELDIGFCKKIDCKNALEVLPTMPWAAQIQKLALPGTDAEGDIQVLSSCPGLTEVNMLQTRVEGVFTGAIIRMISDIRAKHGKD